MSVLEIAGTLDPDVLESRCREAENAKNDYLDTLESHLQTSIAIANSDGDFDLSGKLFGALLWVRMRRQPSHAERYVLKLAESV